jgi:heme exporter protein D
MTHAFYVGLSYVSAVLVVLVMIGWIWLDGRTRRQELAELEAAGIRRRSARPGKAPSA